MKLPWQKKSSETQAEVPEEVKEYYEAGKRERKGVAWLLAFFTLILTVLIVFGAFLGGRWVYRKIAHRGESATVSTQDEGSNQTEESNDSSNEGSGEQTTPAPSPIPAAPSQSAPTTPSVPTSQSTNLANTGPGDTAAIFAVVTVAGTALYQIKLRRQTR